MSCSRCASRIFKVFLNESILSSLQTSSRQRSRSIHLMKRYSSYSTGYGKAKVSDDDYLPWASPLETFTPLLRPMDEGITLPDEFIHGPPPPAPVSPVEARPKAKENERKRLFDPLESLESESSDEQVGQRAGPLRVSRVAQIEHEQAREPVVKDRRRWGNISTKLAVAIENLDRPVEPEHVEPEEVVISSTVFPPEVIEKGAPGSRKLARLKRKEERLLAKQQAALEAHKASEPEAEENAKIMNDYHTGREDTRKRKSSTKRIDPPSADELSPVTQFKPSTNKWNLPPVDEGLRLLAPSGTKVSSKLFSKSRFDPQEILRRPRDRVEPWQIHKAALKQKFGDEAWAPRKKLSPDSVELIRALNKERPDYGAPVLAQKFKVSPDVIRRILSSNWRPSEEEREAKLERWFKRGEKIAEHKINTGIIWTKEMRVAAYKKSQEQLEMDRLKEKFGTKTRKPKWVRRMQEEEEEASAADNPTLGRLSTSIEIL